MPIQILEALLLFVCIYVMRCQIDVVFGDFDLWLLVKRVNVV